MKQINRCLKGPRLADLLNSFQKTQILSPRGYGVEIRLIVKKTKSSHQPLTLNFLTNSVVFMRDLTWSKGWQIGPTAER